MTTRLVCVRDELVTPRPGGEVSRDGGKAINSQCITRIDMRDMRVAEVGGGVWPVPQIRSGTSGICGEDSPGDAHENDFGFLCSEGPSRRWDDSSRRKWATYAAAVRNGIPNLPSLPLFLLGFLTCVTVGW